MCPSILLFALPRCGTISSIELCVPYPQQQQKSLLLFALPFQEPLNLRDERALQLCEHRGDVLHSQTRVCDVHEPSWLGIADFVFWGGIELVLLVVAHPQTAWHPQALAGHRAPVRLMR